MKNAAISERKNQSISRGVGMTTQIYADRAENSEIWDVEGRRYIDFSSGIAVVNTGHRHRLGAHHNRQLFGRRFLLLATG